MKCEGDEPFGSSPSRCVSEGRRGPGTADGGQKIPDLFPGETGRHTMPEELVPSALAYSVEVGQYLLSL